MSFSLTKYFNRIYHDLILGPRGYGRPVNKSVWEAQYQRGDWAALDSLDEMGHYAVIGGYTRFLHSSPSILDVGCGSGQLLKWINPAFESYVGIDVAEAAIAGANTHKLAKVTCVTADFNTWDTALQFDIVIFNESLYYAPDPRATLLRYTKTLARNGTFIVSMCEYGYNTAVWSRLDEVLDWGHETEVKNTKGQRWRVRTARSKTSLTQTTP
jgi:2-polyprenyl-3-methyl-5-hydroxy-6-metoxy-1,4-benzoquinol methylase